MNYGDGAGSLAVTGGAGGLFLMNTPGTIMLGVAFVVVGVFAIAIRRKFRPGVEAIDSTPQHSDKTNGS